MSAKKINVILHTPSDKEQIKEKTNEFILSKILSRIKKSKIGDKGNEIIEKIIS